MQTDLRKSKLETIDEDFFQLQKQIDAGAQEESYHSVISLVHQMIKTIQSEKANKSREQIIKELKFIYQIHSKSPFIQRLQEWPLGYQGDYQTIEMLCEVKNSCRLGSLEYLIEQYGLLSPIAQQHRNKVDIQSRAILESINSSEGEAKILVVGCGSGRDIRQIQYAFPKSGFKFFINDMDEKAIQFTLDNLSKELHENIIAVKKNIVLYVKDLVSANEKFDLILFGGVFDYLSNKHIKFILSNLFNYCLRKHSKIIFTNINSGNPYSAWMEYMTNWNLIERSTEELHSLCLESDIPESGIKIYKETTGLTNIVEVSN